MPKPSSKDEQLHILDQMDKIYDERQLIILELNILQAQYNALSKSILCIVTQH